MVHWCLECDEEGLGMDEEEKIDDSCNGTVTDGRVFIVLEVGV